MTYFRTLSTPRLTLRPPRRGDEDDLFTLHSDPDVMRYFSEPSWTDPARAARQIDDDAAAFERAEYYRFAIILNETQRQIGNCGLFALHKQNRRGEIGYALHSAHWGKGYMNEALAALLVYAFGEHDLHRVEADIDPLNAGSVACIEKLGFSREGLLRERWIKEGQVSDSVIYGLLRRDWETT